VAAVVFLRLGRFHPHEHMPGPAQSVKAAVGGAKLGACGPFAVGATRLQATVSRPTNRSRERHAISSPDLDLARRSRHVPAGRGVEGTLMFAVPRCKTRDQICPKGR